MLSAHLCPFLPALMLFSMFHLPGYVGAGYVPPRRGSIGKQSRRRKGPQVAGLWMLRAHVHSSFKAAAHLLRVLGSGLGVQLKGL